MNGANKNNNRLDTYLAYHKVQDQTELLGYVS